MAKLLLFVCQLSCISWIFKNICSIHGIDLGFLQLMSENKSATLPDVYITEPRRGAPPYTHTHTQPAAPHTQVCWWRLNTSAILQHHKEQSSLLTHSLVKVYWPILNTERANSPPPSSCPALPLAGVTPILPLTLLGRHVKWRIPGNEALCGQPQTPASKVSVCWPLWHGGRVQCVCVCSCLDSQGGSLKAVRIVGKSCKTSNVDETSMRKDSIWYNTCSVHLCRLVVDVQPIISFIQTHPVVLRDILLTEKQCYLQQLIPRF